MNQPTVSVVIPTYNDARYLGKAIESVLKQTYSDLEVLVVDDGSRDNTSEVVSAFHDPRLRLTVHTSNKGLPAARNTGMRAASGEIIALLDADDLFAPDKLETHVRFLAAHPEVGLTYNGRFEMNYSSETIREISQPPATVTLADFMRGFPFTPSDTVVRREWAERVDYFDESLRSGGEDLDFPCRLLLSGCQFHSVGRILNYRRHESKRYRKNLAERYAEGRLVLNRIIQDPRCPAALLPAWSEGWAHHCLVLAFHAFAQHRSTEGRRFLLEAVRETPDITKGTPCPLIDFFLKNSIADDSVIHSQLLALVLEQFPPGLRHVENQYRWAVGRGYLIKAARAMIWNRPIDSQLYFNAARDWSAEFDDASGREINHQLVLLEKEMGPPAAERALSLLVPELRRLGGGGSVRRLQALYRRGLAFRDYLRGDYQDVVPQAVKAILLAPEQLLNRGMISIIVRSLLHCLKSQRESSPANHTVLPLSSNSRQVLHRD
jgi:glycosyltransferase involved in cell wall biosynthesis